MSAFGGKADMASTMQNRSGTSFGVRGFEKLRFIEFHRKNASVCDAYHIALITDELLYS